jgi:hypothetical protein
MVKNTNMLMITTIILIKILPEALKETPIYIPGNNSRENSIREFLKNRWKINMVIKCIKSQITQTLLLLFIT